MSTDMSNITCGCGFSVTGPDQAVNKAAFEKHACSEEVQIMRWYQGLFSFEGIVVLFVLGWIIVEIVQAIQ